MQYTLMLELSVAFYLISYVVCEDGVKARASCKNVRGDLVGDGDEFTPFGSDPCTQCTCVDGKHERCRSLLCSPIKKCEHQRPSPDKCCEFVCIDVQGANVTIKIDKDGDQLNTTNLGLRLVASTVTSSLILALLFFMIHRLRQRRLHLMIRRLNNERIQNLDNATQRYSVDGDIGVGYFVGRDQVDFYAYGDPPPPYTLWKPPDVFIPLSEPPPPYEASVNTSIPLYNTLPDSYMECNLEMELPVAHNQLNVNGSRNISTGGPVSLGQYGERSSLIDVYPALGRNLSDGRVTACGNIQANIRQNPLPESKKHLSIHLVNNDSTAWETVASDTSSSTPSICDRTVSPSSSESSSIFDFVLPIHSRNSVGTTSTFPKTYRGSRYANRNSATLSISDRTFNHLRSFSLLRKKHKPNNDEQSLNDVMIQSHCSTVSNPETSSWAQRIGSCTTASGGRAVADPPCHTTEPLKSNLNSENADHENILNSKKSGHKISRPDNVESKSTKMCPSTSGNNSPNEASCQMTIFPNQTYSEINSADDKSIDKNPNADPKTLLSNNDVDFNISTNFNSN